jgi:hypothetical protein
MSGRDIVCYDDAVSQPQIWLLPGPCTKTNWTRYNILLLKCITHHFCHTFCFLHDKLLLGNSSPAQDLHLTSAYICQTSLSWTWTNRLFSPKGTMEAADDCIVSGVSISGEYISKWNLKLFGHYFCAMNAFCEVARTPKKESRQGKKCCVWGWCDDDERWVVPQE